MCRWPGGRSVLRLRVCVCVSPRADEPLLTDSPLALFLRGSWTLLIGAAANLRHRDVRWIPEVQAAAAAAAAAGWDWKWWSKDTDRQTGTVSGPAVTQFRHSCNGNSTVTATESQRKNMFVHRL